MTDSAPTTSGGKGKRSPLRLPVHAGLLQHSVAVFLGLLVLLFVTAPFIQGVPNGRFIEASLMSVVMSAAVLAVGGRRRTLAIASLLLVPALIGKWMHHLNVDDVSFRWYIAAYLVFIGFVVFQFLRFILSSPRVTSEVLCAAVAVYFLFGLLWAAAYAFVARSNPAAFMGLTPVDQPTHSFDVLYFSMISLTTVGFGDITPVSPPARMLAMMESTVGTMYLAVMIARLVSLHSSSPALKDDGRK